MKETSLKPRKPSRFESFKQDLKFSDKMHKSRADKQVSFGYRSLLLINNVTDAERRSQLCAGVVSF